MVVDLSSTQLRMLRALADTGTVAGAAETLGYTPSAVSQQMKALGRAAGGPLTERVGRRIRLTELGRVMAHHGSAMLRELEAAQSEIERLRSVVSGVVEFGYLESMTTSVLVPLLSWAVAELPEVEIRTVEQGLDMGFGEVQSGLMDVATVIEDDATPAGSAEGLTVEWLRTEPLRLVVPEEWGTTASVVDLADYAEADFVSAPPNNAVGLMAGSACRRAGFAPRVRHVVDVYPIVLRLVAGGVGVALVPELALGAPPPGLSILELADPVTRRVGVTYRTSSTGRPALEAVLGKVRELLDGG